MAEHKWTLHLTETLNKALTLLIAGHNGPVPPKVAHGLKNIQERLILVDRHIAAVHEDLTEAAAEERRLRERIEHMAILTYGLEALLGGKAMETYLQLCKDGTKPVEAIETAYLLCKETGGAEWARELK